MQELFDNGKEDYVHFIESDPIVILGYAINEIVEVKDKTKYLSNEYKDKLSDAYALLNEVQEYLFEN